jgi:hypothetical protein
MTERFPSDNELQCAWDDYLEARDEANRTSRISDGIVAGKMWRRFIYLFADPERVVTDNNVVRLPTSTQRKSQGAAI